MKSIYLIFKLSLVIYLLLVGCGASVHRASVDKDERTKAERRFDPLGFPGDDAVITGQNQQSMPKIKADQDQSPDESIEPVYSSDIADTLEEISQSQVIFRVQVFASKSFDEAQQFAANIEGMFPEGVFVEYQMPYYKVRVGEFYEPEAGQDFLEYVKETGFRNAWLVRVIQ